MVQWIKLERHRTCERKTKNRRNIQRGIRIRYMLVLQYHHRSSKRSSNELTTTISIVVQALPNNGTRSQWDKDRADT